MTNRFHWMCVARMLANSVATTHSMWNEQFHVMRTTFCHQQYPFVDLMANKFIETNSSDAKLLPTIYPAEWKWNSKKNDQKFIRISVQKRYPINTSLICSCRQLIYRAYTIFDRYKWHFYFGSVCKLGTSIRPWPSTVRRRLIIAVFLTRHNSSK